MTHEEKLIEEYLKKNTPKQVETSDTCKDIYSRGYIKLTEGKCCSYCGTEVNENNVYIKDVNKLRIFNDIVLCKRCNSLSDAEKNIVSKVGYDDYLLVFEMKKDLAAYKETRAEGKQKILQNIERIKSNYAWKRNKECLAKRDTEVANETFYLDSYNVTTDVNIDIKKDAIKSFIKNSDFVLKKYLMDYTKLVKPSKDKEIEDYDNDY